MPLARTVEVDEEVWIELQRRAIPLEDDPNSVLRKILGLQATGSIQHNSRSSSGMNPQLGQLLTLVEADTGMSPSALPTNNPRNFKFLSQKELTTAFLLVQPRKGRIRIGASKSVADRAGISSWDHLGTNAWYNADDEVFWYLPFGDEEAYRNGARILAKLWKS